MKTLQFITICIAVFCLGFIAYPRFEQRSLSRGVGRKNSKYRVYRIDSINSFYLIYARDGRRVYKIVSPKSKEKDCREISVGDTCGFVLHSYLIINGHPLISAASFSEVSGWMVDSTTIVPFEGDSIRDLFRAENVDGLCLLSRSPRDTL